MKLVIALGGNALGKTPKEQLELVKTTAKAITDLVAQGHQVIIGHGNGPQVGMINSAFEDGGKKGDLPIMPFAECGAMSQGYIGYHLAQGINNELIAKGINKKAVCLVTQVEVDKNDDAFNNPTKPIGMAMSKEQAEAIQRETGYSFCEEIGRGYRRVVPSPQPKDIVEIETVNALAEAGQIVITVGGGGIPVVKENGLYKGVAAVIDKDRSCALLAREVKADMLIILTAVDYVYLNYGKENQQALKSLNTEEAQKYMEQGVFAKGSMLPKITACMDFVSGGGKAVITALENAGNALTSGTVITK